MEATEGLKPCKDCLRKDSSAEGKVPALLSIKTSSQKLFKIWPSVPWDWRQERKRHKHFDTSLSTPGVIFFASHLSFASTPLLSVPIPLHSSPLGKTSGASGGKSAFSWGNLRGWHHREPWGDAGGPPSRLPLSPFPISCQRSWRNIALREVFK